MGASDLDRVLTTYRERMAADGQSAAIIDWFSEQYVRYREGETGKVRWSDISPPEPGDIVDHEELDHRELAGRGELLLDQLVCIKLNGGLGTSMKLDRAKSLIPVRDGRSFLRLIAEHVSELRARAGARTPLLLMNSFRTRADSLAELSHFENPHGLPLDFVQHRVPRIVAETGEPLAVDDPEACWSPPGHGDVYRALAGSGLLDRLLELGLRWAFLSNADNLAATADTRILGYLEQRGIEFAMEVTPKTEADRKGGTLVRREGRLSLLERAQVEPEHLGDFERLDLFTTFNTNNLWVRIDALRDRMVDGSLALPLIVNPKRVGGTGVVQLESAMGAAIGCFERPLGIRVPRTRFAPVKTTDDLLGVRSDAYVLDEVGGLRLRPERPRGWGPPIIRLDPRYYGALDDFEQRFVAPPSLVRCRSFTVKGDVRFEADIVAVGHVAVRAPAEEVRQVTAGTVLEG